MSTNAKLIQPANFADARNQVRHVFIRDLVMNCSIGIHDFEQESLQRVRVNLDLAVMEASGALEDEIGHVVCYEQIAKKVRALVTAGHINLVETMAEKIAAMCLEDDRVRLARVRVEKLDVFDDAASVGVEIERAASTF